MLDPTTGALLQERSLPGPVRALPETGIAYCVRPTMPYSGSTAVRLEDGAILWQGDEVRHGKYAATESALFSTSVTPPAIGQAAVGHVYAHDAQSGELLWHWHTPDSVGSLLALWGNRAPWLLADGARRIASTLAAVLTEPPQQRRKSFRREISQGQWRPPYGLHGVSNAMSLVANWDAIFLGTRLGVFGLRASDGKLLWHALPTVDISFCQPTLSWP